MKKELLNEEQAKLLKEIEGQTVTYKELTDKLGIKYTNGDSKKKQLKELLFYCDYELIQNQWPTKYHIKEVYDGVVQILSNKEAQKIFDAILFQALFTAPDKYIYLSGVEMLEIFHEVNKNFSFSFSKSRLKFIGENLGYMQNMTLIVYRILRLWTQRRLEDMAKRKLIRIEQGYCLYSTYESNGNTYQLKLNVPKSTIRKTDDGLDSLCDKVYINTAKSMFPWINDFSHGFYVNNEHYQKFIEKLNENIAKATNGKYQKLTRITIVVLTEKEWIREKLEELYKGLSIKFSAITEEACEKILSTSQLKDYSEEQRQEYIRYNIKPEPPVYFWNLYNRMINK